MIHDQLKPITFMHTADLHIGMNNYDKLTPEGKSTRLQDFLGTFDEFIDDAISSEINLVLIAGDIFKTREPTNEQLNAFVERIRRLSDAQIRTVIVAGNHDRHLNQRPAAIEVFNPADFPDIHVVTRPDVLRIYVDDQALNVICLPWQYPSDVPLHYKARYPDASPDQRLERYIYDVLSRLWTQARSDTRTVIVAHAHVDGSTTGSEANLMLGHDAKLSKDRIPPVSYVALGHIHKHQGFRGSSQATSLRNIVYPGSINRVDFAEEHDPKGYIKGEINEGGVASWWLVPTNARSFFTLRVDDCNLYDDALLKAVRTHRQNIIDSVFRWHLVGSHAEMSTMQYMATRALQALPRQYQPYVLAEPKIEYTDEYQRAPKIAVPEGLTPFQTLKHFIEAHPEKFKMSQEQLLAYAQGLMEGQSSK